MTLKETVEAFDGKKKGTSEFILLVPIFVLALLIFINLMVKYKKCGALRIRVDGNKCIVVNLKLPSITSRSTSYLDFLRETILDSNKQEFNNAVETICTRIKSLQYYIILLIITQMITNKKLLI